MAARHRSKVEEVLALSALSPEAHLELLEGEVHGGARGERVACFSHGEILWVTSL